MSTSSNKVLHKATHAQMREWTQQLVVIEQELHRANMHATARRVNNAVRAIGWEFSGELSRIPKEGET